MWAVRTLTAQHLRSWERVTLELNPGLIVVSGPNGAGKTSLVEAVTYVTLGVSPRTTRDVEAVRTGSDAFHVAARIDTPLGVQEREIGYQSGLGRRLKRDGASIRSLSQWRASGAVLVFLPEELRAIKGPPAARRRALDRMIEGWRPGYADTLADYLAAVAQRNAMLRRIRSGQAGLAGLAPWDRACVELGASVAVTRLDAVNALVTPFAQWLAELGGGSGGLLALEPSPAARPDLPSADLEQFLAERFDRHRDRDVQAAQTLSGPHRDDLWIGVGDHDLRRLGSQGEQRTAVLAFLLACRDLLAAGGATPIMLLDDVLSELDPERRRLLLQALTGSGQAWVTSADPDAASLAIGAGAAHHLRVESGRVHQA